MPLSQSGKLLTSDDIVARASDCRAVTCRNCKGEGFVLLDLLCPVCSGSGAVLEPRRMLYPRRYRYLRAFLVFTGVVGLLLLGCWLALQAIAEKVGI